MRRDVITGPTDIAIREGVHPDDFAMDYHTHQCYEIGIVLGGEGKYEIAADEAPPGRAIDVSAGILLLWDGKVPHRAVDVKGKPLNQMIVTFGYEYLSGTLSVRLTQRAEKNPFVMNDPVAVAGAKTLMRRMMAERRSDREGMDDLVRAYMIELAAIIVREDDGEKHAGDVRVRSVLSDIAANYHEELTPERYAAMCGLSVRRFSELFKRATGATFVQYLTTIRIEHAKELLTQGHDRVLSIAFGSGYDSVSHFNETFKKVTGMTPTEFRGKR